VKDRAFETARKVIDLEPKIAPTDKMKHETARALVEEHVDVDALVDGL